MTDHSVPVWKTDGLLSLTSEQFQQLKNSLRDVPPLLTKLTAADKPTAAQIAQAAVCIDLGRDLVSSLITACKAARAMHATGSRESAERAEIKQYAAVIEGCADRCFAVLDDPITGPALREREENAVWWTAEKTARKSPKLTHSAAERRMTEPLSAMYSHFKAMMKLSVVTAPGTGMKPQVLSASSTESLLKNSVDMDLRRRLNGASNAWYAEHATPFADMLNAELGCKLNLLERAGLSPLDFALEREGLSRQSFEAMMKAVREAREESRAALQIQHAVTGAVMKACGQRPMSRLSVSQLIIPFPSGALPEELRSFGRVAETLAEALGGSLPSLRTFMQKECAGGWVEGRNLSMGEAGSWCADVPTSKAVAIYADYQPTVNRADELAHALGEAALRSQLLALPPASRHPKAVHCEIFGRFFSLSLQRHLIESLTHKSVKGDGDASDGLAPVMWLVVRSTVTNLLNTPFRYELGERLYEERTHRCLSVSDINRLTSSTWEHWYADAVDGCDQYIWAHKPHFHMLDLTHYDFQYTFGYLVAGMLLNVLRNNGGRTASGDTLETMMKDAAVMSCEALLGKHLGDDIRTDAFWRRATATALAPLEEIGRNCRRLVDSWLAAAL